MEIEHITLSGEGFNLEPLDEIAYIKNVIRSSELEGYWNLFWFNKIQLPMDCGYVPVSLPTQPCRILDCPIKFPGDADYRIPMEATWAYPVIQHAVHLAGEQLERYAYLTLDYSFARKGKTQRHAGCHVDGFQGARIGDPLPADHSFVWVNKWPTEYFSQSFMCHHLDRAKDDYFSYFDSVADESKIIHYPVEHVLWMNAYTVHRAAAAQESGYRAFIRLLFSVRRFDRLGNTHNPMFKYDWNMVNRDTPSGLRKFTDEDYTTVRTGALCFTPSD